MGLNFYYYDGLQPKMRAGMIYMSVHIVRLFLAQIVKSHLVFLCFLDLQGIQTETMYASLVI